MLSQKQEDGNRPKRQCSMQLRKDLDTRFAAVKDEMVLGMAYTCSEEEAQEWKQEIMERFPGYDIVEGPLSPERGPAIIGPGSMAVTCMKRV